jgi:hypothetical protein
MYSQCFPSITTQIKKNLDMGLLTADVSAQIFLVCTQCTRQLTNSQNVDALYQINKGLAADLSNDCKSIGEVFLGLAPFLKLYAFYCENHDAALEVVAKLKKKKKEFAAFDEVYINATSRPRSAVDTFSYSSGVIGST